MELSLVEAVVVPPVMSYDAIISGRICVCATSNELRYIYQ